MDLVHEQNNVPGSFLGQSLRMERTTLLVYACIYSIDAL